ncbi:MAG: endonuclease [Synergistaceae bacterium]|nr:endonuclease [Synergistaceae bacterium]
MGVDPGRDKTGWALVRGGGELVLSGIVPAPEAELFWDVWPLAVGKWEEALAVWTYERRFPVSCSEDVPGLEYIALGNGTGSRETARRLCGLSVKLNVRTVLVDEKGTTLEARERYWALHRPALWQNCLPRRLRVPSRAVDDLAAWVIALRSLSAQTCGSDAGGAGGRS